jgi:hypothetical protein
MEAQDQLIPKIIKISSDRQTKYEPNFFFHNMLQRYNFLFSYLYSRDTRRENRRKKCQSGGLLITGNFSLYSMEPFLQIPFEFG